MANFWYCDSVQWTAVTAWAASTAVAAGVLRRQLAVPAVSNERVWVCIIAGTTLSSEPTWVLTVGSKTVETAGPTWQECTGQPGVNGDTSANCPNWTAIKNLNPGLGKVIQNNAGTYLFICSTAGTAGNGAEPSWNLTAGVTTTDNTVTWTCLGAVGNFGKFAAPHSRLNGVFNSQSGALGTQAGDCVFVGDDHAETQTGEMDLGPPIGAALRCRVYCVDRTVVPPTAASLKTTATVSVTGSNIISFTNQAYYNGIIFNVGSGTGNPYISLPAKGQTDFVNCSLRKLGTTARDLLFVNNTSQSDYKLRLTNTTVQFGNVGDFIDVYPSTPFEWRDTPSAIIGAIIPTNLIFMRGITPIYIEGVDLSAMGSNGIFGVPGSGGAVTAKLINCKLATGYSMISANSYGTQIDLINCDSGATNYQFGRYAVEGQQTTNTVIVRTGGSSDGTTPVSWVVSTSSSNTWSGYFECLPISIWNSVLATNRVVTLYGIWNGATRPNTNDIWLYVEYLGSASSPLTSQASQGALTDFEANVALPADSTSAWDSAATARANTHAYLVGDILKVASNSGRIFFCTTAGTSAGSEPAGYASAVDGGSVTDSGAVFRAGVRFTLTVTLSSPQPAQGGYIRALIRSAAASSTFYVDPLIVLS
jgi:hypothetical protein